MTTTIELPAHLEYLLGEFSPEDAKQVRAAWMRRIEVPQALRANVECAEAELARRRPALEDPTLPASERRQARHDLSDLEEDVCDGCRQLFRAGLIIDLGALAARLRRNGLAAPKITAAIEAEQDELARIPRRPTTLRVLDTEYDKTRAQAAIPAVERRLDEFDAMVAPLAVELGAVMRKWRDERFPDVQALVRRVIDLGETTGRTVHAFPVAWQQRIPLDRTLSLEEFARWLLTSGRHRARIFQSGRGR